MLVEGRADVGVGSQGRGGQQAGLGPGAVGAGPVIVGDRSGEGAVVIVVGGVVQGGVAGVVTAPLAGPVMVVVLGAWPPRALAPGGGRLPTPVVVAAPGLTEDGHAPLPHGQVTRPPGPGSPARHHHHHAAEQVEEVGSWAVGVGGAAAAARVSGNLFRREGEYWTVVFEGVVVRLRDAKGLGHLARLLADPGREFHVVDLEAANRQTRSPQGLGPGGRGGAGELWVRPDLGDAGALLDATAKAAYQARLGELGAELEEAEADNDPTRAARARAEREFLVAELARAVGLGGRDRRAAAHAERARLNVTRAIRTALVNLTRVHPALGRHLAATVRTGRYCSYTPDPRTPIAWQR